jgi:hypothetical protein
MPTQQRFGAKDPVGRRIVLRLVVELELTRLDGLGNPLLVGVAFNRLHGLLRGGRAKR